MPGDRSGDPRRSRVGCDVDLVACGKRHGHLRVPYSHGRSAYGWIPIPITVAVGAADGPSILLIGGNHGDEYEGPIALRRLARELDPERLAGRVVIMPALNWPAFAAGMRTSPIDDANLNRCFPGDRNGTPSQMLAHHVEAVLLAEMDWVVDLHAGGLSLDYAPLLQLPQLADDASIGRRDAAAAAFGLPISMELDFLGEDRTLQGAAERSGTAWFGAELGGGAGVNRAGLAGIEAGLRRFLRHADALRDGGDTMPGRPSRFLRMQGGRDYLYAPADGVFEQCFGIGDTVVAGQLAGVVHQMGDPDREPIPVSWPGDGEVVCRRTLALVERGDCLGHLASAMRAADHPDVPA